METSLRLSASSQKDFIPSKSKIKNHPLAKKKSFVSIYSIFSKKEKISNLNIRSKLFHYVGLYITQNVSETQTIK